MSSLWKLLTSLRLTIWLLGFSVVLVFLGSIAQAPEGLWNAQSRWFKSLIVIRHAGDDWWVPPVFPGGHLLGGLLLLNLLAAHAKRFQWNFQKVGIQLTHFGIIVLLVGQFISDRKAVESFLQLDEGETKNYTEHHRDSELVFMTGKDADTDEVVSFPEELFRPHGLVQKTTLPVELKNEKLPFTVRVEQFGMNGELLSLSQLPKAAERLKTALATLDGKFSSTEALVPIAEADMANMQRAMVWRHALNKLSGTTADVLAEVKTIAADPKRAADLAAKVKAQFRADMLGAFRQMAERSQRFGGMPMGSEMGFVAELEAKGQLANADKQEPAATNGSGKIARIVDQPEIKDDTSGRNFQWAIIEILDGEKSLGTWLVSSRLNPQEFEVSGKNPGKPDMRGKSMREKKLAEELRNDLKDLERLGNMFSVEGKIPVQKWRVVLRNERYYLPYSIRLVRAKQEVYQGTTQAREFASRVQIANPEKNENRGADITMNNPLRYAGLTFYQSKMDQGERGPGTAALLEALTGRPRAEFASEEQKEGGRQSGLQVVQNPSMLAPYTGCLLVGFGMLWQFLFHLTGFLAKRGGLPPPGFGVPHPLLPLCAVLIMVPDIFLGYVAWKNGTLFALAVVAVTPFIRGVLAWQVWHGKYLVFAMVLLLVPTVLAIPFALKYQETHGAMLWPVTIAQFAAFLGIAYVVLSNRPRTNPALA